MSDADDLPDWNRVMARHLRATDPELAREYEARALLAAARRNAGARRTDKAGRVRSGLSRGRQPGRDAEGMPRDPSELLGRFPLPVRVAFALLEARSKGFRGELAYDDAASQIGVTSETVRRHASRAALVEARAIRRLIRRRRPHDLPPLTSR